ncbi:MAG: hypothetical protein ABTQ26_00230 [Azonexus sp.]
MHINTKISDGTGILGSVDPVSTGPGTVTTAWVPVANFLSFMALVATGILGASATVDAKIQQAQDVGGTGAKDIPGKALTQIVKASGDGKQALIDFRVQDLDTNNGFGFVRVSLTVGVAASQVAAYLLGGSARFEPIKDATAAPAINLGAATVVQIV